MHTEKEYCFVVSPEKAGMRVDSFLDSVIDELSRSALAGGSSRIMINSQPVRKSAKVRGGDEVRLCYEADVFYNVEKQDISLDIIYEDEYMLVINKAQGMVVHPGNGNPNGTVVNALAYRYGDNFINSMKDECNLYRPGIVHRLDKDTSGVMVIALTPKAHEQLALQFHNHLTEKVYLALCEGFFVRQADTISCLLARDPADRRLFRVSDTEGKTSCSEYRVLKQFEENALLEVRIHTGRTHQIRVHMKSIGHPVVGDVLYGSGPSKGSYKRALKMAEKRSEQRGERTENEVSKGPDCSLMLHSFTLDINHPKTGERMHFEAPVPARFLPYCNFPRVKND